MRCEGVVGLCCLGKGWARGVFFLRKGGMNEICWFSFFPKNVNVSGGIYEGEKKDRRRICYVLLRNRKGDEQMMFSMAIYSLAIT